jgi:hypothetical protein
VNKRRRYKAKARRRSVKTTHEMWGHLGKA